MDQASAEQFPDLDKVEAYRLEMMLTLFPAMTIDEAEELALGNDRLLIEKARKLADAGCPAEFAYRILLPLPDLGSW